MKALAHRIEELRQRRFEANLEGTIKALFRRCPTLCGFSVRDAGMLLVAEVSVFPLRDLYAPAELCDEITAVLVALIDECPEIRELLRERTFARVLH